MPMYKCSALIIFCCLLIVDIRKALTTEFTCENGTTFFLSNITASGSECADCETKLISCNVSNCTGLVDAGLVCNGIIKCDGMTPYCDAGCPTHYRCSGGECRKRSTLCDGDPSNGCRDDDNKFDVDDDDGWSSGVGFKCTRRGVKCLIPQSLLYDDVKDCDNGDDLCYSSLAPTYNTTATQPHQKRHKAFNQSRCFQCFDGSMVIPRSKVCDGDVDCSDLSDECLCEEKVFAMCDKVQKCDYSSGSNSSAGNASQCALGQLQCSNGSCINRTSVCDTKIDCNDGMDERGSSCGGTLTCDDPIHIPIEMKSEKCRCKTLNENVFARFCDTSDNCPIPSPIFESYPFTDECHDTCENKKLYNCNDPFNIRLPEPVTCIRNQSLPTPRSSENKVYFLELCDGIPHCINKEDEKNCPQRFYCLSGSPIHIDMKLKCNGQADCDDQSDESEATCPDRFFCRTHNPKTISIDRVFVCDSVINCDDSSDEFNCSRLFYCENGQPLFVSRSQVFNGHSDCSDSSDECPKSETNSKPDVFSSRYHLISNPIFRCCVWLMAVLALGGNMVVIALQAKKIKNLFKRDAASSLKTYNIVILNLAVADFFMGIYLLMLGIAGAALSGEFCLHELEWRGSVPCQIMGILVVISSEASIIFITILASFRAFAVFKPFIATTRPSTKTVLLLMFLTWATSLTLAYLPLAVNLEFIFVDKVILEEKSFFKNIFVEFEAAKDWVKNVLVYDQTFSQSCSDQFLSRIDDSRKWSDLLNLLKNTTAAKHFNPVMYFGYYGTNTPCIPQLFVTRQDKFWQYSLGLCLFNFILFVYIVCAYVFVIAQVNGSTKKSSFDRRKDREIIAMQKKLYRIVAINFTCWVPILVMSVVTFSGIPLPAEADAIAGIILLPINSAFDPIVYSNVIDVIALKLRRKMKFKKIGVNRISERLHQSLTGETKL